MQIQGFPTDYVHVTSYVSWMITRLVCAALSNEPKTSSSALNYNGNKRVAVLTGNEVEVGKKERKNQ